jgi:hypothetical protein
MIGIRFTQHSSIQIFRHAIGDIHDSKTNSDCG